MNMISTHMHFFQNFTAIEPKVLSYKMNISLTNTPELSTTLEIKKILHYQNFYFEPEYMT